MFEARELSVDSAGTTAREADEFCALETPVGLEIVDYKTDRVSKDDVPERAAFYKPQMDLYRDAIAAIVGKPLAAAHLVFLEPRVILTS